MGNPTNRRGGNRFALKHTPLALACATALLLATNVSHAQDATKTTAQSQADADAAKAKAKAAKAKRAGEPIKELDTVKVTGIRRGIENSIEKKKNATSIVEVISSEDIGKLPDSSIAESLARVPGLAAQRVAGRASVISIRGLPPDFSTALLNGRDQVSVGGARGVEFDQYPSELINGVTIYKTPDARLVGQGLSGTVDLQTLKPLSFAGRKVALNARLERNSLGEINPGYSATGNRLSATYIDQFADHTIGVALGIARLDSPGQNERWRSWGYPDYFDAAHTKYLGGSQFYASSTKNVRTGLVGVLEYRPNATYSSTLDLFYSRFNATETTRGMEVGLAWSGATLTNPVIQNGVVVSGTYTGVNPVVRSDQNTSKDDVFAIGWNNKFKLNEDWTAVVDLSMSRAKRDIRNLELYAGRVDANDNPLLDTVSYSIHENGFPTFSFGHDYSDPSIVHLTDSSGWGQSGFVKSPQTRDQLRSFRASLKRDFVESAISSIEFGLNYADREKQHSSAEYFIDLIHSPSAVPSNLLQPSPAAGQNGGPPVIAYDVNGVFNSGLYRLRADTSGGVTNRDWTVREKVFTFYSQLNLDTNIGSVPVHGNVGVQYVGTNQSSDGFATTGNNGTIATPYSAGTKYNNLLPSANLAFNLPYDQIIHLAAARQIARAPIDEMRANNSYSCNSGGQALSGFCRWSGSGGNPMLKPYLANAYDISYEKYFGIKAYVGLAFFYKDLKSYIYDQSIPFDYSSFTPPPGLIPIRNIDNFDSKANGKSGSIYGEELTLSVPFNLVTQALDGFGAIVNVSDTHSSIQANGPNRPPAPIPGLSRVVTNLTLYYEKNGFSTRISQRHRSDFIGAGKNFQGDSENQHIKAESVVDFQAGYEFQTGRLAGLSVLLQVNNLTNAPYAEFIDTPHSPRIFSKYGRSVLFGVNYKF